MVFAGDVIQLVHHFPCLYDPADEDYKNHSKKEDAWNAIGDKLNHPGEEVKKKWRNLRDTYMKYLRNVKQKSKNRQKFKRWQWAIQMSAFHQYIVNGSRTSTSVLRDEEVENDDEKSDRSTPEIFMELEDTQFGEDPIAQDEYKEESQYSNSRIEFHVEDTDNMDKKHSFQIFEVGPLAEQTKQSPSKPRKRKVSFSNDDPTEGVPFVDDLIENYQNKKLNVDAVDLLFLAYAKTVKTFSAKRQALVKLKVAEVLSQQEILHLEEQETSKGFSNNI